MEYLTSKNLITARSAEQCTRFRKLSAGSMYSKTLSYELCIKFCYALHVAWAIAFMCFSSVEAAAGQRADGISILKCLAHCRK